MAIRTRQCGIAITVVAVIASIACACGQSQGSRAGGSSHTVSAREWKDALCTSGAQADQAIQPTSRELDGLELEFKYGIPTKTHTRGVQVAYFDVAASATAGWHQHMVDVGVPDIPQGERVQTQVVASLGELAAGLQELDRTAHALPTGSERAAADSLLVGRLDALMEQFGDNLQANRSETAAGRAVLRRLPCPK